MDKEVSIIDQRPTTNDPIHVALAVHDPKGTYSQHAGVTITSIFENTKSKVIVHLLHDDTLTEDNRNKFIRTAERYNQTIELINVANKFEFNSKFEQMPSYRSVTIGALYRLLIPDLLPEISKTLYVDCDIIFDLDVRELWDIDVEDYCMAGVHDYDTAKGADRIVRDFLMGCDSRTYINSGVLVMNLNMIRNRGNLFQNAMNWLDSHVHLMWFSDQDIINGLFYKSIRLIERRFNNKGAMTEHDIRNSIIHTAGKSNRAWEITGRPYQVLYWKIYLRSEWGKDKSPEELIETISSFANTKPGKKIPRYKRIAFAVCSERTVRIIKAIKYIIKDARYRIMNIFSK